MWLRLCEVTFKKATKQLWITEEVEPWLEKDVMLKSNSKKKKKKKLSKKEKCLNSDDARCQTLQNSIICLSHLTLLFY